MDNEIAVSAAPLPPALVPAAPAVTEEGLLLRFDQRMALVRTSLEGDSEDTRAMRSRCLLRGDIGSRQAVGHTWHVKHWFVHAVSVVNESDGEERIVLRLVLFVDEGKVISTTSKPCLDQWAAVVRSYTEWPYEPGLPVVFREFALKEGRSYVALHTEPRKVDLKGAAKKPGSRAD